MLSATPLQLTRRQYAILGRLLLKKNPLAAHELLTAYLPYTEPLDFSKVPLHFQNFCAALDLSPEEYTGPLYSFAKVSTRRLFIACIIRLYVPYLYEMQPESSLGLTYGLVSTLSKTLQQKKGNISNMIREVIVWEKQYDDFRSKVDSLTEKLKGYGSTGGK